MVVLFTAFFDAEDMEYNDFKEYKEINCSIYVFSLNSLFIQSSEAAVTVIVSVYCIGESVFVEVRPV